MLPFCGYHMGDYFKHWLGINKKMEKMPKIFHVNWFKLDEKGKFMWPGFSDNMRIIEWILSRCDSKKTPAKKTPIGYMPRIQDIDLRGLRLSEETLHKLFHIDKRLWYKEVKNIKRFFKTFGKKLPKELKSELAALKKRLK